MKYTFEVNTSDMKQNIKVEINFNNSLGSSVSRSVTFVAGSDDYVKDLDELLTDVIDNMRLTVKEREEAIYNAGVLKWYLQEYKTSKKDDKDIKAQTSPEMLITDSEII